MDMTRRSVEVRMLSSGGSAQKRVLTNARVTPLPPHQLVTEEIVKELTVTISAEEYREIIEEGFTTVKKRFSRLWDKKLTKKKGAFRHFDLIRIQAHGFKDLVRPISVICKTSIGKKPNTVPVFAIKFRRRE